MQNKEILEAKECLKEIIQNTYAEGKTMSKKNKNIGAVYDRQMIRKILRSQLKTNKIRDTFHDKEALKHIIEAL